MVAHGRGWAARGLPTAPPPALGRSRRQAGGSARGSTGRGRLSVRRAAPRARRSPARRDAGCSSNRRRRTVAPTRLRGGLVSLDRARCRLGLRGSPGGSSSAGAGAPRLRPRSARCSSSGGCRPRTAVGARRCGGSARRPRPGRSAAPCARRRWDGRGLARRPTPLRPRRRPSDDLGLRWAAGQAGRPGRAAAGGRCLDAEQRGDLRDGPGHALHHRPQLVGDRLRAERPASTRAWTGEKASASTTAAQRSLAASAVSAAVVAVGQASWPARAGSARRPSAGGTRAAAPAPPGPRRARR